MEDLTIPGWALYLIIGMIAWLLFLTRETYANSKSIAINTANDKKVADDLEKIYKAIDDTKESFNKRMDRVDSKLDEFLGTLIKQVFTTRS